MKLLMCYLIQGSPKPCHELHGAIPDTESCFWNPTYLDLETSRIYRGSGGLRDVRLCALIWDELSMRRRSPLIGLGSRCQSLR